MSNKSLFIQVGSYNSTALVEHLEHLRAEHRNTGEDDYIYNVVLTMFDGHYDKLDLIRPYLPGGSKQCFDNVFVGTHELPYTGSNPSLPPWQQFSPYAAGILDPDFRWKNLQEQKKNWIKFKNWYGGVFHFYVGYEAVVTWWTNSALREAHEAYLVQSVWDAEDIAPGRAIMWSPSFWDKWGQLSSSQRSYIKNQVDILFKNIKWWTQRSLNWFHPQDAMGTTSNWGTSAVTTWDVVGWYTALAPLNHWDSFRVNMEHFKIDQDGSYWPISRLEYTDREQAYALSGVPQGASWELRWWYQSHVEVADDIIHGSAYTMAADNISYDNRWEVSQWLRTGELNGQYANRAYVTDLAADIIRERWPLEVQGDRYMRPYSPNPSTGRAVNSDHLTAGALDIFFRNDYDEQYLDEVMSLLSEWKRENIVRYIIELGANAAHHDHIHVSFQLGVY